ncbi:MAG: hypothetical protein WKF75_02585 [Singulisphaera sp.]
MALVLVGASGSGGPRLAPAGDRPLGQPLDQFGVRRVVRDVAVLARVGLMVVEPTANGRDGSSRSTQRVRR